MQYLLAFHGLVVRAFNKPEDLLALIAARYVPVVVLDIWMKGDRTKGRRKTKVQ